MLIAENIVNRLGRLDPNGASASDSAGHPIIENYVLVRHTARHLKSDVTPHAPEHNDDYRTPRVYYFPSGFIPRLFLVSLARGRETWSA